MTRFSVPILLFLLLLLQNGCKLPNDSAVIDTQIPPTITDATVFPSSFDLAKFPTDGPTVTLTLNGSVQANDDNGLSDIAQVSYTVYAPTGTLVTSGSLHDDGVAPDVTAGDGVYNVTFTLTVQKALVGTYTVMFGATDKRGNTSTTHTLTVKTTLSTNHAPVISELAAPDTIMVPMTKDTVRLAYFTVRVSDAEGSSDIASVLLTSQRPDSSVVGTFFLSDDGGNVTQSQFGLTSGDSVANDGIYSIVIPVFSTTQHNTYRDFFFLATDRSNAVSNVIQKRVILQ